MTIHEQLIEAARYDNIEKVQAALAAGADVNYANQYGSTALTWACQKGHTEIVRLLLTAGANVNDANQYGSTALIWACAKGYTKIVRMLLAYPGIDVYYPAPNGETALSLALDYETTRLLINHVVASIHDEVLTSIYEESDKKLNIYDIIKYLIKKIVNENHPADEINHLLRSLNFLLSAYNSDAKKSARKEARTFLSGTIKKRVDAVIAAGDIESLQSEKEKIELICNSVTLLQKTKKDKSEKTDKVKIMKLIEKIELSIQALKEKKARSPLIQALHNGKPEEALALIEKGGIDINAQGEKGETALCLASEGGYESVVKALLRKDANPNLATHDGATPLYIAAFRGRPKIVSLLLTHNADENVKYKGLTPLGIAAYRENTESVTALLKHAASKDNNDQNLIDIINGIVTFPLTNVFLSTYDTTDLTQARKNIQTQLVAILKERAALTDDMTNEINRLQNIKSRVNLLEKTTTQAINALITELKAKQTQLERSAMASPANAAICLTLKDSAHRNDLAKYLLNTEMTPHQSIELLNNLKELSTEQFDYLKQQLKDFASDAKREAALLGEQKKLKELLRADNDNLYNANPFFFILRTGTSEYEQKDTDSFDKVKTKIMGSALKNGLKNLTTFASRQMAPKPRQEAAYNAIGNNNL